MNRRKEYARQVQLPDETFRRPGQDGVWSRRRKRWTSQAGIRHGITQVGGSPRSSPAGRRGEFQFGVETARRERFAKGQTGFQEAGRREGRIRMPRVGRPVLGSAPEYLDAAH